MADFSALTQQQRISAEIPYKNIALGNPAETLLNAWAMTTGIKLKQQEFQGRMAALAAKNRALELDMQLDRAKFGLAAEKMELDYGYKASMADIARGRMENTNQYNMERLDVMRDRMNTAAEGKSGILHVYNTLAAEGLTPKHPNYLPRARQLLEGVADSIPNSVFNKTMSALSKDADDATKNLTTIVTQDEKDFRHHVNQKYFGGGYAMDIGAIEHPERLKPKTEGGWFFGLGEKATDEVEIPDPADPSITRTFKMREVMDDNRRWKEIQQRKANLPTRSGFPHPLPSSKADMVVDEKYDVPGRGVLRWTGTELVPP